MTTLKKLMALLLAIMMLFSAATLLAGCEEDSGKKKKSSSSKKDEDEDEDEDEDKEDEDEDKEDEDKDDEEDEDKNKDDEDEDKDEEDDKPGKVEVEDEEEKPGKEEVSSNNTALVGTWEYKKDIAKMLNDIYERQYGDSFVAPNGNMYLYIEMEFEKDGDYTMSINLDEDSAKDYLAELCVAVADCIYAMLAEQGLDKDAVDAQLGMSAEEYCRQMITYESLVQSMTQDDKTGYYYEEDGKIYIAESEDDKDEPKSYMIYTISGKKLTISDIYNYKDGEFATESEEMQNNPVTQMPWVLEKQ